MIYLKIYNNFVESVDGIDNGINQYPSDVQKAYSDSTNFSSRISRYNPKWSLKKN